MKVPSALAVFMLLGACTHIPVEVSEPILTPIEVDKPVATGCVPANMAAPPKYPDTDDALRSQTDAASRYQLLYAGRKVRIGRLGELEPVIARCPKAQAK